MGKGKEKKEEKGTLLSCRFFILKSQYSNDLTLTNFLKVILFFSGGTIYRTTVVKLHHEYIVYSILHIIHYYT